MLPVGQVRVHLLRIIPRIHKRAGDCLRRARRDYDVHAPLAHAAIRTPALLLVTPYLADANNGNWRTAARWARLLSPEYRVIVQAASAPVTQRKTSVALALIALHARRSHSTIAAWRDAYPDRALIVALTGTDLYRDLPAGDAATRASLAVADRLLVLQDDAPHALPAGLRARPARLPVCATLVPWPHKSSHRLHCVLVAHLREEKDPATAFAAWRLLPATSPRR